MTDLALLHVKTAISRAKMPMQRRKRPQKKNYGFISSKPLKSLDSDERIQGNPIAQNQDFRSETARRQEHPNLWGRFAAGKAANPPHSNTNPPLPGSH